MECLYCHKKLGLFASKKRPFCSELHEVAYHDEQAGVALRRVLDPLFTEPVQKAPLPRPAPPKAPKKTRSFWQTGSAHEDTGPSSPEPVNEPDERSWRDLAHQQADLEEEPPAPLWTPTALSEQHASGMLQQPQRDESWFEPIVVPPMEHRFTEQARPLPIPADPLVREFGLEIEAAGALALEPQIHYPASAGLAVAEPEPALQEAAEESTEEAVVLERIEHSVVSESEPRLDSDRMFPQISQNLPAIAESGIVVPYAIAPAETPALLSRPAIRIPASFRVEPAAAPLHAPSAETTIVERAVPPVASLIPSPVLQAAPAQPRQAFERDPQPAVDLPGPSCRYPFAESEIGKGAWVSLASARVSWTARAEQAGESANRSRTDGLRSPEPSAQIPTAFLASRGNRLPSLALAPLEFCQELGEPASGSKAMPAPGLTTPQPSIQIPNALPAAATNGVGSPAIAGFELYDPARGREQPSDERTIASAAAGTGFTPPQPPVEMPDAKLTPGTNGVGSPAVAGFELYDPARGRERLDRDERTVGSKAAGTGFTSPQPSVEMPDAKLAPETNGVAYPPISGLEFYNPVRREAEWQKATRPAELESPSASTQILRALFLPGAIRVAPRTLPGPQFYDPISEQAQRAAPGELTLTAATLRVPKIISASQRFHVGKSMAAAIETFAVAPTRLKRRERPDPIHETRPLEFPGAALLQTRERLGSTGVLELECSPAAARRLPPVRVDAALIARLPGAPRTAIEPRVLHPAPIAATASESSSCGLAAPALSIETTPMLRELPTGIPAAEASPRSVGLEIGARAAMVFPEARPLLHTARRKPHGSLREAPAKLKIPRFATSPECSLALVPPGKMTLLTAPCPAPEFRLAEALDHRLSVRNPSSGQAGSHKWLRTAEAGDVEWLAQPAELARIRLVGLRVPDRQAVGSAQWDQALSARASLAVASGSLNRIVPAAHADRRHKYRPPGSVSSTLGMQPFRASSLIQIREPQLIDTLAADLRQGVLRIGWKGVRMASETGRRGLPLPIRPGVRMPRVA